MTEASTKLPLSHPISLLATWFCSGKSPKAPGTMGTLAALPFAHAIWLMAGDRGLLTAALVLFLVGVWVSEKYMEANQCSHDPGEIVIDEVAGVWLLLVALPHTLTGYVVGFVLFRIFDILKPWPISLCDRKLGGGFGVMFDDLAAAVYPVILLGILAIICGASGLTWLSDFYGFMGQE